MKALLYLLLLFSPLLVLAQRPMSYQQLKPKIDSINQEQRKITAIYSLQQSIMNSSLKNESNFLIYFIHDSLRFIQLDKENQVIKRYTYRFPSLDTLVDLNVNGLLTGQENEMLLREKDLMKAFHQSLEEEKANSFLTIMFHEKSISKLYGIREAENQYHIPFNHSMLFLKSAGKKIELIENHKRGLDADKSKELSNNALNLSVHTIGDVLYISALDIFIFKEFGQKWSINSFSSYSRKNKREFIYHRQGDSIEIVKHPIER